MSTITADQLFTVDGFTQACMEAFDAELENQLGIDIEDYNAYLDVARIVLKDQVEEGGDVTSVIKYISDDPRLTDIATSMELWEYIRLNPDFGQYVEFHGTTRRLEDTLFDTFYDRVVHAPERAIREYFDSEYGIDPFDGKDRTLTA